MSININKKQVAALAVTGLLALAPIKAEAAHPRRGIHFEIFRHTEYYDPSTGEKTGENNHFSIEGALGFAALAGIAVLVKKMKK